MAVEAVQTNWISFQLITLFIFLLCVFCPAYSALLLVYVKSLLRP
jgi:hypothetical protein